MLARLARINNNIALAESRIKRVCDNIGSRLETEESPIIAKTYEERSNIHRVQGEYQDALAELENALRIEIKIYGSQSPKVIELQNEKVKPLIRFRRLTEANHVIESALRDVEHDQPIFKRLKSNLLEQRGILLVYKKEYDQAIESLEEAIKLNKEVLGNENVELARLYVEKAVVLRHLGHHTDALASLDAAQGIDNLRFKTADHIYYARILLEQGKICLEKGDDSAAQAYLKEALEIYAVQQVQNVKEHADAAEALGLSYLKTGFLHESSKMFQKAMKIRKAIFGSSHPEIAEALCRQSKALSKMEHFGEMDHLKMEARQKLEQALNMLGQRNNDNAELISEIERTLADL
jgi:tetratricopeptide (TPR) repeat protein